MCPSREPSVRALTSCVCPALGISGLAQHKNIFRNVLSRSSPKTHAFNNMAKQNMELRDRHQGKRCLVIPSSAMLGERDVGQSTAVISGS